MTVEKHENLFRWAVVMRPQIMPPDGSSVHDELDWYSAEDSAQAIRFAYQRYKRKHWYVLDVYKDGKITMSLDLTKGKLTEGRDPE